MNRFTKLQGQYLTFIHAYKSMNGRPPAEKDLQDYFGVTPPSVHQMILTLEKRKLISRIPGQARSIQVLITPTDLPQLEGRSQEVDRPRVMRLNRRQKEYLQKQLFGRMMPDDD